MGRLRASIKDLTGVKFDRKLVTRRMRDMGVTDVETLTRLLDEMEAAQSRAAFLQWITTKRGKRG